jgi:hypothetical protein
MFNENLKNQFKEKIVHLVTVEGRVPIAEIVGACEAVADVKGTYDFDMVDRPGCVLWPNLSEELVIALREVVAEGLVVPIPVFGDLDLVILVIDTGVKPALPIATELPKNGFRAPHWVPVVLSFPTKDLVAAMEKELLHEAIETDLAERRVGIADGMSLIPRATVTPLDTQHSDGERVFPRSDEFDELSSMMVPDSLAKDAPKIVEAQAERIFREGARGNSIRALVSRDIAAGRAHVPLYQAILDAEVQRVGRGKGDPKVARLFADILDRQHRRMTTSCELLLRLDSVPTPSFRVEADQAFVIGSAVTNRTGDSG